MFELVFFFYCFICVVKLFSMSRIFWIKSNKKKKNDIGEVRASLIGRRGLFLLRRFRRSVWSELFHLWWNHKRKQLMSVSRRRRLIFISRRTHTRLKTRENKIPMLWFMLILDTAVQVTHSPETAGQQRYCTCSAPVQLLHFMSWTLRICLLLHV